MMEDRELDNWREQWNGVAEYSPEFQCTLQQKIRRQERRFLIGNLLTLLVLVGVLIFAAVLRLQAGWLGTGWATGVCVFVVVSAAYRLRILRGTWRAEMQSTRAFMELWRRRIQARIQLLRIGIFLAFAWVIFCGVLTVVNWTTIGPNVKLHPGDWLTVLVASVLMQPVLWFWAAWLRRRSLAELNAVEQILNQIKE